MDIPAALFGDWLPGSTLPASGVQARLGAGVDRKGYAFGEDFVLKVGTRAANLTEVRVWNERPDLHPYLCPIVAWAEDGSWLVMRRATEVGTHERHEMPPAAWHLIDDAHAWNIGRVDGKLVYIDYGYPQLHEFRR